MKKLLSIQEAAEYTGFTVRYLRRLIFELRVPYHKDRHRVWFAPADLDAYVESMRIGPADDSLQRLKFQSELTRARR